MLFGLLQVMQVKVKKKTEKSLKGSMKYLFKKTFYVTFQGIVPLWKWNSIKPS